MVDLDLFKTFEKVFKKGIVLLVGYVSGLTIHGYVIGDIVQIDPNAVAGFAILALEGLRNVVKHKYEVDWL